jgi:hypothetical protein
LVRRADLTAVAVILGIGLMVGACDHGGVVLAENQTDDVFIARAIGNVWSGSGGYHLEEVVSILAPNSKLVVVELPFTGGFQLQRVDVLTSDCALVESLQMYGDTGTYIVINDDRKVELRKEYPERGTAPQHTDRCRSLPVATPAPSSSTGASTRPSTPPPLPRPSPSSSH